MRLQPGFEPEPALWLAVALTLVANVLLPLQDALTKLLVVDLSVSEVLFVRSATVLAVVLAIGRRPLVERLLHTPNKRFMTVRGLVMLAAWTAFILAVRTLPLAQAITLYFVSPILVSLLAGPFLGERVAPLQWLAVGVGFAGVWLASGIVGFDISSAVGMALLSACLWSMSLLMLRSLSSEEGSLVQVAFANGVFVVATAIPLAVGGFSAGLADLPWMIAVGLIGGAGQFMIYEATRRLPVSVLGTLEYTSLISAFALGYLIFADIPTLRIWLGAALILVSGVMAVRSERHRSRGEGDAASIPRNVLKEGQMPDETHDLVAAYIARTRFPFPGQTTWAADYRTLTNVPQHQRAIPTREGDHYPDIVILDGTGRVRELGEVEMEVDPASLPYLKAASELTDNDTPTGVKHFFLYVPAGLEAAAQALLEDNGISYAGVRGFTVNPDRTVRIVPFVTKGDPYDHQLTDPAAA